MINLQNIWINSRFWKIQSQISQNSNFETLSHKYEVKTFHSQQKQNDLILSLTQHKQDKIMVYLIILSENSDQDKIMSIIILSLIESEFLCFPGIFRLPYSSKFCSAFWDH